jgi:hypothetical protein
MLCVKKIALQDIYHTQTITRQTCRFATSVRRRLKGDLSILQTVSVEFVPPAMPRKLFLPIAIFSISTVGIIRAHSASIYGE